MYRERRLSTLYILENIGRQTEYLIHVSFLPFISVELAGQSAVSQAFSEARKSTPDTFTARVVCHQSRIWTFV